MAEQQRKKTTPVARSRRRRPAPRGPVRAIRRRLRRLYRRHPQAKSVLRVASASLCLLAVVPPMITGRFRRAQGAVMLGIYAVYIGLLISGVAV